MVIEGDEVYQAGCARHESTLAEPDPVLFYTCCVITLKKICFSDLPRYQGQDDRPVDSQILLPILLVDGHHISKPPVL